MVEAQEIKEYPLEGTTLFNFFMSSGSWRVRLAMAFKKIEFKSICINLSAGEQKSEAYKKVNPTGLVPALFIDGHLLTESSAICEYLEETRPDGIKLLPSDPYERSKVREICQHVATLMQPLQNLRTVAKLKEDHGTDRAEWTVYWNKLGLE